MDDLGFNKIAAAVLVTALGFMLIKEVPHMLMHSESPEIPAYALEIPEVGGDTEAEIEVPFPSPAFIAAMDATKGEKVFKKCVSCHNADKGGANGTGPSLYGVVGNAAGQHSGFKYSSAMTDAGLTWDYETLNDYLTKPTAYVKGTAMNFVGLKKEDDRAAVIEYLRLQADSPIAQPEAAAPIETAEAPEEGTMTEDAAVDGEGDGDTMTDDGALDGEQTETQPLPAETRVAEPQEEDIPDAPEEE